MFLHAYIYLHMYKLTYIYLHVYALTICTYTYMCMHLQYVHLHTCVCTYNTYIYILVYALTIRTWCIDLYFITGSKEKLLSYVKFKRILLEKRTGANPTPIEAMAQPLMSSPTEDPVQSSAGRFSLSINYRCYYLFFVKTHSLSSYYVAWECKRL